MAACDVHLMFQVSLDIVVRGKYYVRLQELPTAFHVSLRTPGLGADVVTFTLISETESSILWHAKLNIGASQFVIHARSASNIGNDPFCKVDSLLCLFDSGIKSQSEGDGTRRASYLNPCSWAL